MGRRLNRKRKAAIKQKKQRSRIIIRKSSCLLSAINKAKTYLSHINLTDIEILTLGKGLKFVPTPRMTLNKVMRDFEQTQRKMRLRVMFNEINGCNENKPMPTFKRKSTFTPITTNSNTLENYLFSTKMELSNLKIDNKTHNMTKQENNCLRQLKDKKDIVIRKADKGNSIVILNKQDYIDEGLRQLNDGIHY